MVAADRAVFGPVEAWSTLGGHAVDARRVTVLQRKKRKPGVWRLPMQSSRRAAVIAKRCSASEAACEQLVYDDVLPATDVPSLQCFGVVPDPDDRYAWVFVEDAGGSVYTSESERHRHLAGEWLGRLHGSAASFASSAPLPDRGLSRYRGFLDAVRELSVTVADGSSLSTAEREAIVSLRTCTDEVDRHWPDIEAIDASWPRTLVHGSFSCRNMHVRDDQLRVFDWGAAGWGSAARDVVKLVGSGIGGDAAAYRAAWSLYGQTGTADLGALVALGGVLRGLEHLFWSVPKLSHEWRDAVAETIERHCRRMGECISRLERSHA